MKIDTSILDKIPSWFQAHGAEEDVVLSSRVRLSRNLTGFLFPRKLDLEDEIKIKDIIINAFDMLGMDLSLLSVSEISGIERRMLVERYILSQDFILSKHKSFILNEDQNTSCMINELDHLRLVVFDAGLSLQTIYKTIDSIELNLEKVLDFAVSLEFGYLNENVRNSGTGLKASVILHLPALVHLSLFDRAIKSSLDKEYTVKGYMGNDEGSLGDLYQISNGLSIGYDEKTIIEKLTEITLKLVNYERQARVELVNKRKPELEDRFYRSLGLISSCRLLNQTEAVKALTDIRLGIVLGFSEIDILKVNSLLLLIQKAHIQNILNNNESDTLTINLKRSELVKNLLGLGK